MSVMARALWLALLGLGLSGCAALVERGDQPLDVSDDAEAATYEVLYSADFLPADGIALVEIRVTQDAGQLREADFRAPASRYKPLAADGELVETDRGFLWRPPEGGGVLTYEFKVANQRGRGNPPSYDARMEAAWALLRADHLFPPARTRTAGPAQSQPWIRLTGPDDWHFETRYGPVGAEPVAIRERERRFIRPTGWMVAGQLGIRRDEIAGIAVAVAGPTEQGFRRNDILAMLNWNLSALLEVFPDERDRLLIVGANDPSWRGGLSGPYSLYLHTDRPMVNEDGTSTVIHELVHVYSRQSASGNDNWIIEGIADFYAVEIMRRTGTITAARFERAVTSMAQRAQRIDTLKARGVNHDQRAAAARLMYEIDQEIRAASNGRQSLDDLMPLLEPDRTALTQALFETALTDLLGRPSETLSDWAALL